ncbi:hypothetical protein MYAM1_003767 [Malassezia yamatoensis]|uniref:Uncharacterized protein n=1 Tax=Malassezia yamatoensis TaxID=253288 RepID=A0AAJ6CKR4_9BASI|nr:hypothetical protein MYAM1_003767 [Malassezia yamatoensis]
MEAFSSGSELSSAEEASDFEPDTSSRAQSRSERASRRRQSGNFDEKQAPTSSSSDPPRRKRNEARDVDAHPRMSKAPQPKRAKIASQDDQAYKEAQKSPSLQSSEPSTEDLPANPTQSKPKPPMRTASAKPIARVATPTPVNEDPVDVLEKRSRATPKPNASEPAFSRNMSGWDQLFGPIAQTSTPKSDTRAKDATPEQRAAAAEIAAKEREAENRQRSLREKAQQEKEQAKQAQERKAHEAAAAREAANARREQRPTSVSVDELNSHRRRLQSALRNSNHFDLLAGCRLMASFEDEMGADRRHLRPSRFGAGLHYLSLDTNAKQQDSTGSKLNGDAQTNTSSSDLPKNSNSMETKSTTVSSQDQEQSAEHNKETLPIVSSSTSST